MTEDDRPIAYTALPSGTPVLDASARPFGTVERVVADTREDIFHGIVVATSKGKRFVNRTQIQRITTAGVLTSLRDAVGPGRLAPGDPSRALPDHALSRTRPGRGRPHRRPRDAHRERARGRRRPSARAHPLTRAVRAGVGDAARAELAGVAHRRASLGVRSGR